MRVVTWLLRGRIAGNLTSNGSEAFLRQPPTRRIPCESRKGSSLYREDCFRLNFISGGAANLSSRDLTCCEDFKKLLRKGGTLDGLDDYILCFLKILHLKHGLLIADLVLCKGLLS